MGAEPVLGGEKSTWARVWEENDSGALFRNLAFTSRNPEADVAASNDLFVVVWVREGQSGGTDSVLARLIDVSDRASPVFGDEWVVSDSSPSGRRSHPAVAADGAGNVVVVWVDTTTDLSDSNIFARRLRIDDVVFLDGFESGDLSEWNSISVSSPSELATRRATLVGATVDG